MKLSTPLFISQLHDYTLRLESLCLVSLFLVVLGVAITQIFLRNFFDYGLLWADTFLRISVLWLGLLGALFASRNNNHINMNLGLKYLSASKNRYVRAIVHLFTALICLLISWYGWQLVLIEIEDAGIAFAAIPTWLTLIIIPFSFFIIFIRYLSMALLLFLAYEVDDNATL